MSLNFAECRYFTKFKWPYFGSAWCYSHEVGHAGSPTRIVHADKTRSKVKVKVMGLLKFGKLPQIALFYGYIPPPLFWRSAHNMGYYDSMGLVYSFSEPDFWSTHQLAVTWLRSSRNVDITRIHCILSPRWPRLEACDWDCRSAATAVHAGGDDRQLARGLFSCFCLFIACYHVREKYHYYGFFRQILVL